MEALQERKSPIRDRAFRCSMVGGTGFEPVTPAV